jgi:hypothetical protein
MPNKKYSIDFCKTIAIKREGLCLSDIYINPRKNLLWECKNGHKWYACLDSIKRGSWCRECAGLKKLTIEQAKVEAIKRNGKCLSTQLVNSHSKLLWECNKGHKWEASLANVRNKNSWCMECFQKTLTIEDAKNHAEIKGGLCLSTEYNHNKKLIWECNLKHQWRALFNTVKNNDSWCPECARINRIGKPSWAKGKTKFNCKTIYEWSLKQIGRKAWNTGKTKFNDVRLEKSGLKRKGRTKETGDLNAIRSSERMKNNNPMKDMRIREKAHSSHILSPNKPETLIISKQFPNLKFTGDHSFWINFKDKRHKNPDFVVKPFHTNKKVIEVWGEYWHRNENPSDLIQKYNEVGIQCLILPYQDIKNGAYEKMIKDFICT